MNQKNNQDLVSIKDYQKVVMNSAIALKRLQDFSTKLNLKDSFELLENAIERVENNSFSLAVVGEFNRGKSTLINALLGQQILPSDIIPTTATLNRITYGLKPLVKIIFKNGQEEEIEIEQLTNYVTKLTSESKNIAVNVEEAIIFYPTFYCQNNVDIIDTPGLNDDEKMNSILFSVLSSVDAVIFVIMAQSPFSSLERDFFRDYLLNQKLGKIIVVVNGIDRVTSSEDAERIVNVVKKRIQNNLIQSIEEQYDENSQEYKDHTARIGQLKVFGISAFQALQAKTNGDATLLAKSGFSQLEIMLEKLMTEERGLIFLQVILNRVATSAKEIITGISIQKDYLEKRQKEIKLTYEKSVAAISNSQNIEVMIEEIKQKIRSILNQIFPELKQNLSRAIDTASITSEDFNQSVMLKNMLQHDRKTAQIIRDCNQKLAVKIQTELQLWLDQTSKNLQSMRIDEVIQLSKKIELQFIDINEILTSAIINSTIAWNVACTLKARNKELNSTEFNNSYQREILKEIARQLNLHPIHQEIYDALKTTLALLKERTLPHNTNSLFESKDKLTEFKIQLEREETTIQLKIQELDEIQLSIQQLLSETLTLSEQLMKIVVARN
ncbi:MAG: dynamin family protein [Waterburya sp.]